MLELFLAALEDQLGLLVNPPLAPIARMNVISLEITRLIRAAELPLERTAQQSGLDEEQDQVDCPVCGVARRVTHNVVEMCPSCGDYGIDLLPDDGDG